MDEWLVLEVQNVKEKNIYIYQDVKPKSRYYYGGYACGEALASVSLEVFK